jgi:thymidine phosphorylase
MLLLAGVVSSMEEGEAQLSRAIADGSGLERLRALIAAQKGDPRFLDDPRRLPAASGLTEVTAPRAGRVRAIDTEAVGLAAVVLGAGRQRAGDRIDPSVGFTVLRSLGDRVERGETLVRIHHRPGQEVAEVAQRLQGAFHLAPETQEVAPPPLFLLRVEGRP